MKVDYRANLERLNTLGLPCTAESLIKFSSSDEVLDYFETQSEQTPFFVLGAGSNVLLPATLSKAVLSLDINTIDVEQIDDHTRIYRVGAGVVWDEFVAITVEEGYRGVENLSWIPGTVGAAPVQNIGAYGTELEQVIEAVHAYDTVERKFVCFQMSECQFAYRNSIFKRNPGRFVILRVDMRLSKEAALNLSYSPLNQLGDLSQVEVRQAVIETRKKKLPDYKVLPNAGSFYKNPIVDKELADKLLNRFPDIPFHSLSDQHVKLPAGWLIERVGFKGRKMGPVSVHQEHALVLVNQGGTRDQLLELSSHIQRAVNDLFQIELVIEPDLV